MIHLGTQPIETKRLRLRRLSVEDAPEMYGAWATDPLVTQYMRWDPHQNVDETRDVLQQWCDSYPSETFYLWGIELKETGALIGTIGVFLASEEIADPTEYEPGYCLGRAYWGQGYASEALCAVMDYMVDGVGLKRLHCCHAVANPASGRVMEKAGFRFVRGGSYTRLDGTTLPAKIYLFETENAPPNEENR